MLLNLSRPIKPLKKKHRKTLLKEMRALSLTKARDVIKAKEEERKIFRKAMSDHMKKIWAERKAAKKIKNKKT